MLYLYLRYPNGPPIRDREPDNNLIASGYQWDERSGIHLVFAVLCVCLLALFGMNLWAGFKREAAQFLMAASACGFISSVFWDWRRSVIFHRDGRVGTPGGTPRRFWRRQLRTDTSKIASIEVTREGEHYGVGIFTTEGETFIVSHNMRAPDARLVAVQLTKALHELRASNATVEGFGRAKPKVVNAAFVD